MTQTQLTPRTNHVQNARLTGERAAFQAHDRLYTRVIFADGESPLKHSHDISLDQVSFQWKYPLWYANNVEVTNSIWNHDARAGVWYTNNLTITDSSIDAPKNFRRCNNLTLRNVELSDTLETLWSCSDVTLDHVHVRGDYFSMNSTDMEITNLHLVGGYCFDGAQNVTIRSSRLVTKDAFWNSNNVTVYDSYISSEYLGWNASNLTLINCTIESLQGLCYVDNLVMRNCTLLNTNLAFEYSTVDCEINGHVDSVLNPTSGRIVADSFGSVTLDETKIDPTQVSITTR